MELEVFAQHLTVKIVSNKGIEGTVTINKSGYIPGRGINVDRIYNFSGMEYKQEGVVYDDEASFDNESLNDCQTSLASMVPPAFDIEHVRTKGYVHRFRIKTSEEFEDGSRAHEHDPRDDKEKSKLRHLSLTNWN